MDRNHPQSPGFVTKPVAQDGSQSAASHVMVWVALVMLTGLTVTVAGLHLGAASILVAIAVAAVKGTLVLSRFMHLAQEPPVFKVMLGVAISILVVIMVFTFVDVAFR